MIASILYWSSFALVTVLLMATEPTVRAQPALVLLGVLIIRYRGRLRAVLERLPLGPTWMRFGFYSLIWCVIISENFFISFRGDLHPNLFLNTFLWLGSIAGLMLAWWYLVRKYAWSLRQIFVLAGVTGLFLEQIFLVPRLILQGQFLAALLLLPFLHALYGSLVTPVVALMEPFLPRTAIQPGLQAKAWAVVLPGILFWVGSLLIPLWSRLLGLGI